MPELPEVETIRRDLASVLPLHKIGGVEIYHAKSVAPSAAKFKKILLGNKIQKVERRGKLLILPLTDNKNILLIHLKMTGQLIYFSHAHKIAGGHGANIDLDLPSKSTHVEIDFANGAKLYFNDQRRFGYCKIIPIEDLSPILKKFGPEPLAPTFTLAVLRAILQNSAASVKAQLLNQIKIAGIGNIYADEICFAAGVRPMRRANSLTDAEIKKIFLATHKILRAAIAARGTTMSDFVDGRGAAGGYQKYLKVYGRAKEKCRRCGALILKTRAAGRGTHYCPECQK